MRRTIATFTWIATAVLSGCGAGAGDGSSVDPTAGTGRVEAAAPPTSGSAVATAAFCERAASFGQQDPFGTNPDGPLEPGPVDASATLAAGSVETTWRHVLAEFDMLTEAAPPELFADLATMRSALDAYTEMLATAGWDLLSVDPAVVDQLLAGDTGVDVALDTIDQFVASNCAESATATTDDSISDAPTGSTGSDSDVPAGDALGSFGLTAFYQSVGLTDEQVACLTAKGAALLDPDVDDPTGSAVLDAVTACGIDPALLTGLRDLPG